MFILLTDKSEYSDEDTEKSLSQESIGTPTSKEKTGLRNRAYAEEEEVGQAYHTIIFKSP